MRRRPLALLLCGLALGAAVVPGAGRLAGAAEDAAVALPGIDHLTGSKEELAGWAALAEEKWVKARELAEKVLREHPDSYAAHYVLGVAFHYGEGDLARAVYHLDLAAATFERTYTALPRQDAPWRWHQATLQELATTLGEMDRPERELQVLDKHDAAYVPKRIAQRVWPLMKLHRYDDSRLAAKEAASKGDPVQRIIARSDLCAAECEAGDRQRAYTACTDALSDYREPGSGGQVEYSNASEAALAVFRYDDCERFLLEAAGRATADSWTNPYQHLAELYMLEGRLPEAIEAVKSAQQLRERRPAWLDQHGQARLDGTVSELFLLAGIADRAVLLAERAVARPDRQGVQSGTEVQAESASAVRLAAALRELSAREEDQAITAGVLEGAKLRALSWWHGLQAWRARRRAAVLLSDERFLVRSLRPYYVGNIDLPFWLIPEAVDAVGAGVVRAALGRARDDERHPGARVYFDALEVQALFSGGDCEAAEPAAREVAQRLPTAEALLRGRLQLIAGECARRRGDLSAAAVQLQLAMARDPGLLMRLGAPLPVRFEDDGSGLGARAARLVSRSSRFAREGDARMVVSVRGGQRPEACLLGPGGEKLACGHVNLPVDASDDTGARLLAAEFLRAAFALKVDLSQGDLTSLDGSPSAARADRRVQSLIDVLGGGDDQAGHAAPRGGGRPGSAAGRVGSTGGADPATPATLEDADEDLIE